MKNTQKMTWLFLLLFACSLFLAGKQEAEASETVVKGSYTYFAENGIIYKMHNSTGKIKKVLKVKSSNTVEVFAVKGDWLYLTVDDYFCMQGTDKSWKYICRVKTNGKSLKKLTKGTCPVVYGKYIYYIEQTFTRDNSSYSYGTSKGIYRMSLSGSGKRKIANPMNSYSWIKIYNKRIYFSGRNKNYSTAIGSVNLSGKDLKTVASGNISGEAYFYKNVMYMEKWSQGANDSIYTVDLKTGTLSYLLAGSIHAGYNGELYYSSGTFGSKTLYRYQINKKKSVKVCKKNSIRNVIGGKKWIIVNYYRGNVRQNIGVDRMKINGKSKKTLTKYFRS